MRRGFTFLLAAALSTFGLAPVAVAQVADSSMTATRARGITWNALEVPGFDPGLKLAVIEGNPEGAGPYTLRLSFPDGYRFPAHWHPNAENLTVLSGTFRLAMGTTVDDSRLQTYGPGDFLHIEGKHPHYGGVSGPTVVQLHGTGPFAINLVEKATP